MNRIVIAAVVVGLLGLASRADAQAPPTLPGGAPYGSGGQFPSAFGAGVVSGYGYGFPNHPGINPYYNGGYPLSTRGSTPYTIYPGGGAYGGVLGGFSPLPNQQRPAGVPGPPPGLFSGTPTRSITGPLGRTIGVGPAATAAPTGTVVGSTGTVIGPDGAVVAPAGVVSPAGTVVGPTGTTAAPVRVIGTGRLGRRFGRW